MRQQTPRSRKSGPAGTSRPAKPGPAYVRWNETRRQILFAAADVFSENGYKATTLRDIAESARMQAGSLYYYFQSKEAMLQEVLNEGFSTLDAVVRESVDALPKKSSIAVRLRQALRSHLSALLDAGNFAAAFARFYNELPPSMKRRNNPARLAYIEYWRELILTAQKAGDIRADVPVKVYVDFVIGALARVPEWYDPTVMSVDGVTDWIADWLLHGVSRTAP